MRIKKNIFLGFIVLFVAHCALVASELPWYKRYWSYVWKTLTKRNYMWGGTLSMENLKEAYAVAIDSKGFGDIESKDCVDIQVAKNHAYFALFDPRHGSDYSKRLANGGGNPEASLYSTIKQHMKENPNDTIERSFEDAYRLFKARTYGLGALLAGPPSTDSYVTGNLPSSYAVSAYIIYDIPKPVLYLAWVGVARALLINKDGALAYSTVDHDISNKSERARIEKAGGQIFWGGVYGKISKTRLFTSNKYAGLHDSIIAEPEIKKIELTKNNKFLVLGSRHIFRALTNDDVVSIIKNKESEGLKTIAKTIIDSAAKELGYKNKVYILIIVDLSGSM